jgi:hypothetical protein
MAVEIRRRLLYYLLQKEDDVNLLRYLQGIDQILFFATLSAYSFKTIA